MRDRRSIKKIRPSLSSFSENSGSHDKTNLDAGRNKIKNGVQYTYLIRGLWFHFSIDETQPKKVELASCESVPPRFFRHSSVITPAGTRPTISFTVIEDRRHQDERQSSPPSFVFRLVPSRLPVRRFTPRPPMSSPLGHFYGSLVGCSHGSYESRGLDNDLSGFIICLWIWT